MIGTCVRCGESWTSWLFLLVLLLTPVAVQAQSAGLQVVAIDGWKVTVRVSWSAPAKDFSVHWGDSGHTNSRPGNQQSSKNVAHVYGSCGTKTITMDIAFENGHMAHVGGASATLNCTNYPSTQAIEPSGGQMCDAQHAGGSSCRPSPPWFIDNKKALARYIEEIGKRQARARERGQDPYDIEYPDLFSFGYRCPDSQGYCDTVWIPGPADNRGLSSPDKFATSDAFARPHTGFQRIDADGIGIKSIVDQNPIDAIDVWGPGASTGGEVCFHGTQGRLIYLDARTSPRQPSNLSTYLVGNTICGRMPGPGSVVYLPPEG